MMIEIDGWKVGIKFSASHFIPGHKKCSRIHGHDYGIRVRVFGEIENGMLYDFVALKKKLRAMAEEIDHHLILPKNGNFINYTISKNNVEVDFHDKHYSFPREDVVFLEVALATAEELSRYFGEYVVKNVSLPSNIKGMEVCVDEGPGQGACHYIEVSD